jgi:hypothetical protein
MDGIGQVPGVRTEMEPAAPGSRYAMDLGSITHALVGYLATECRTRTGPELGRLLWAAAGRLATAERFGRRARTARMSAAGAAAVYHRYFLPPPAWRLIGVELDIEGGRIDLGWELEASTVVFDELKLAFGRSRPRGFGPTTRQARNYLAHGKVTFGERFAGVRVLLLGAPRHSMLVGPGDQLRRLSDTPLWFAEGAG